MKMVYDIMMNKTIEVNAYAETCKGYDPELFRIIVEMGDKPYKVWFNIHPMVEGHRITGMDVEDPTTAEIIDNPIAPKWVIRDEIKEVLNKTGWDLK